MRVRRANDYVTVTVSEQEVEAFKVSWPCSGLPSVAITFEFEPNGDLVGIHPESAEFDGAGLVALSQDAQREAFPA